MTAGLLARTASAPISWGVCEMPGWGQQLPVERFLGELNSLGITATELGSIGYLPSQPDALRELLHHHGLTLTGGFNALALADPAEKERVLAQATAAAGLLAGAGATTFVTCMVSDPESWDRPELSSQQWDHAMVMLDRVDELCAEHGLVQVFHPHVDSLVETAAEIQRVLDNSGVSWVLETGHMFIGGFDPLAFAAEYHDRVGLVHLKDLGSAIAARLNAEELTLMGAVQAGLFVPLGQGDVPIEAVITTLEANAYQGWYVIEQDAAITGAMPAPGDGPIRDVEESVAFLRLVEQGLGAQQGAATSR